MRLRDTTIWLVCIVLTVTLIIAAGMRLDFINSQRKEMKLIINEPLENAPPSLAFATVAMGAFRGLVVDVLWLRADRLQDQGQFFDAKQLAEWITILQPRFASVWEFHAWNMAYNISVAIPESQPDQRWQWIKNGYELLRDKGIPLNPKSILLYRQLAMTFQHKIGGVTDAAHKYYKVQLALAMEPLLGAGDKETFAAFAQAPVELEQVVSDPNIYPLISALKSADKIFEDDAKLVTNYLSLRQNPGKFAADTFRIIENFRGTEALEKFDVFAKAWQLRNTWKLDPVLMQELNSIYGPINFNDPNEHLPLDWRHPDSHAIYWAVKGLQLAGREEYSIEEAHTDRIVNHSLQNLFRNGKIFIYAKPAQIPVDSISGLADVAAEIESPANEVFLRPDLRMFETYDKSVLAVIEKYKGGKKGTSESMQIGHRNMLINATLLFYQAGKLKQAREIYNKLRKLYPSDDLKVSLPVFARSRLIKELEIMGLKDAKEMVQALLRDSYFRYAVHDDDEATGREKMAREVYDHYQTKYQDENRINLPDFKLLKYFALLDFFNDLQYPPNLRLNLLGRIKVEKPEFFEQLMLQEEKVLKDLK